MTTEPGNPIIQLLINNEPNNPWRYQHDTAYPRYEGEPDEGETFEAPLSMLMAHGYGRPGISHERAVVLAKRLWHHADGHSRTTIEIVVAQTLALLPEDVAHGCFGTSNQPGVTGWEELDGRQRLITDQVGAPSFRVDAVLRAAGVV